MTLVDRYVFAAFLRVLGWSLLAFLAIYLLVDLFDHLDNFLDDNASVAAILRYYFYQLPFVIDMILPVSMLLASMFTFALLGKNNEYAALLSAGVSLGRLSRMILLFALLVSVAAGLFREYVVPAANRRQQDVKRYEIENQSRELLRSRSNFQLMDDRGRLYVVRRFRANPPSLESLSIQAFADSTMLWRVDSKRAAWEDGRWVLYGGSRRNFDSQFESMVAFGRQEMDDDMPGPEEFSRQRVEPNEMGYAELAAFSQRVARSGGDPRPYQAALAQKLSFPLVNAILVLLGLGLGAGRRRATLWAGFGGTVGLSFVYYLFMNFGLQLGRSGAIPIWASAWSGNIVYTAAGVWLFLRANR